MEKSRQSSNTLRFDIAPKLPSIARFESAQEEAKLRHGLTVEVPWRTARLEHLFIVACVWEANAHAPEWTLTEKDASQTRLIWIKKYAPTEIRALYETVCADTNSYAAGDAQWPGGYPMGANPAASYTNLYPPHYAYAQNVSGTYPAMQMQGTIDSQMLAPHPMAAIPMAQRVTGSFPAVFPYAPSQLPPAAPSSNEAKAIATKAQLILCKLLNSAGLINEAALLAAMKLQELIEAGKIQSSMAPGFLARYHFAGASINAYIQQEETLPNSGNQTLQRLPSLESPYDLLHRAGILTNADIQAAQKVSSKNGGDLTQILKAAGNLEPSTLLAARTCLAIIRAGLMQLEQSVTILRHCQSQKVDFDTALNQLGWPDPRKLRPDLSF
jgi:hypothetical protein